VDQVFKRTPSESFGPELWTWRDLIVALTDRAGARASAVSNRLIRTATLNAYRDMGNHNPPWKFLNSLYDISLDAAVQLTGTYDHTGGTSEREFVVSDGTIPSWAEYGTLLLDNVPYEVDKKVDSTHLTLTLRTNPGQDVASSTATLYRTTYPAPADFVKATDPQGEDGESPICYLPSDEFVSMERQYRTSGTATWWTITGHPKLYGTQAIRILPYPTIKTTLQIPYRRQLRRLTISGHESTDSQGTVTGSSGATTLTVNSGAPSDRWVGAIIRLRTDTEIPGNVDDQYPYHFQAAIVGRSSNTLTLDRQLPQAYTTVGYVVSDPLDMPQYALNALQDWAYYWLCKVAPKDPRDLAGAMQLYHAAVTRAMEIDAGYIPSLSMAARIPWSELDDPAYVYPSP
jgi:hypothetical protein